jgi:two-component system NarL family sensor kinase
MTLQIDFQPRADRPGSVPPLNPRALWLLQPEEDSSAAAATLQQLIDDLPEQIALLDADCTILSVNRAWRQTVADHGYTTLEPGFNYRDFCNAMAAEGYQPAVEARRGLEEICSGRRDTWELVYNGQDRWSSRDYRIAFHRMQVGERRMISVTRVDVTELIELRRARQAAGQTILETQGVERQRLARELHDSTAQSLVAVSLLLGRLKQQYAGKECLDLVDELEGLIGEAQQEIRSISYLAHPPALAELGLVEAMNSLVVGFGRRTNLLATFDVVGDPVPLSAAAEGTLYRIAQEGLSNVHRHAAGTRVRVLLCFRSAMTHLIIADDGTGVSDRTLAELARTGVGLASMRARLSELGGRLSIRRLSPGTAVAVSLPAMHRLPPKLAA